MTIIMRISLLFLISIFTAWAAWSQPQAEFAAANEAYQQKDYETAIAAYERLLGEGLHSTSLYYNLGNAYYRSGKLGRAVLNYERALRLSPADQQTKANLQIVNQELEDVQVGIRQSGVVMFWYRIQHLLSGNAWSWVGLFLLWLGLAGLGLWLLGKKRRHKKLGFFGGIIVLALSVLPFLFAYGGVQHRYNSNEAIILVEETQLKAAPEEASKTIQALHEGTKVRIIDQIGSWNRVELTDTSEGWLPKDVTERI